MLPVAIINLIVLIVFAGFWVTTFVILYHFARFGVGIIPKRFSALFLLGGVVLFGASLILYHNLDLNRLLS